MREMSQGTYNEEPIREHHMIHGIKEKKSHVCRKKDAD